MSYKMQNFIGFCPVQEKEYSISVTYCGDGALEGKETFSRGRFECSYQKSFGCPRASKCPIMKEAPFTTA